MVGSPTKCLVPDEAAGHGIMMQEEIVKRHSPADEQAETRRILQMQVDALRVERDELKKRLADARTTQDELRLRVEQERSSGKKALAQLEAVTRERDEAVARARSVMEAEQLLPEMEKRFEAAKATQDELNNLLEQERAAKRTLQTQLENSSTDRSDIVVRDQLRLGMEQTLEQMQKRASSAESERDQAVLALEQERASNSSLQRHLDLVSDTELMMEDMRKRLAKAKQTEDELWQGLEKEREGAKAHRAQVEALTKELDDAVASDRRHSITEEELRGQLAATKASEDELRQSLAQQRHQIEAVARELDELRAKDATRSGADLAVQKQLAVSQATGEELWEALEQERCSRTTLRTELDITRKEYEEKLRLETTNCQVIKQELETMRTQRDEALAQKKFYEEADKQLREVQASLTAAKDSQDELRERLNREYGARQALQQQIEVVTRERDEVTVREKKQLEALRVSEEHRVEKLQLQQQLRAEEVRRDEIEKTLNQERGATKALNSELTKVHEEREAIMSKLKAAAEDNGSRIRALSAAAETEREALVQTLEEQRVATRRCEQQLEAITKQRDEIAARDALNCKAKEALEEVRGHLATLRAERDEVRQAYEKERASASLLQQQAEAARRECQDAKELSQIRCKAEEELQGKLEETHRLLASAKSAQEELRQNLQDERARTRQLQIDQESWKQEREEMEKRITATKATQETLWRSVEQSREGAELLEAQLQQATEAHSEARSVAARQCQDAQERYKQADLERQELERQCLQLRRSSVRLETELVEVSSKQRVDLASVQELSSRLEDERRNAQNLQLQLGTARTECAEALTQSKLRADADHLLEEVRNRLAASKATQDEQWQLLEQERSAVRLVQRELEMAVKERDEAHARERAQTDAATKKLEQERRLAAEAAAQRDKLDQCLEQERSSLSRLRTELHAATRQRSEAEERSSSLLKEAAGTKLEKDQLSRSLDEQRDAVMRLRSDLGAASTERDAAVAHQGQLTRTLEEERRKAAQLLIKLETVTTERDQVTAREKLRADGVAESVQDLQHRVSTLLQERLELQRLLKESASTGALQARCAKEHSEDLQKRLDVTEAARENLRQGLEQERNERRSLETQLRVRDGECKELRDGLSTLEGKQGVMLAGVEEERAAAFSVQAELRAARQAKESMEASRHELSSSLEQARSETVRLKMELETLQVQHSETVAREKFHIESEQVLEDMHQKFAAAKVRQDELWQTCEQERIANKMLGEKLATMEEDRAKSEVERDELFQQLEGERARARAAEAEASAAAEELQLEQRRIAAASSSAALGFGVGAAFGCGPGVGAKLGCGVGLRDSVTSEPAPASVLDVDHEQLQTLKDRLAAAEAERDEQFGNTRRLQLQLETAQEQLEQARLRTQLLEEDREDSFHMEEGSPERF